jgi:hypothetical protein
VCRYNIGHYHYDNKVSYDTSDSSSSLNMNSAAARSWIQRLFGIDPRSLAIFRMAIGTVLLCDLWIRSADLEAMYTDTGMFPREFIAKYFPSAWSWSFHYASGSVVFQGVLFFLAAVFAVMMLVGYQTRWATVSSWLMLVSIQNRVPPIQNGADNLMTVLMFWAMFLPLGQLWSVDAWKASRRDPSRSNLEPVVSPAAVAIMLQMAMMYFFSAIFKTNPDWLEGRAIAASLTHDFYAKPTRANFALQFPTLLYVATIYVLVLEWVGPLLLFSPWRTGWLRLIAAVALATMHLGIDATMMVGMFSYTSIAGLTLFIPEQFWQLSWVQKILPASDATGSGSWESHLNKSASIGWSRVESVSQAFVTFCLVYVIAVNINGLPGIPLGFLQLNKWEPLWTAFGLGQKWSMFEGIPSRDGWYVARARLQDGSEIDLLRQGQPVNWSQPEFPAEVFPNDRWRKFFREMTYFDQLGYQRYREPTAEFLARRWNATAPADKQVTECDFIFCMLDDYRRDGNSVPEILRERLVHVDLIEDE